VAELEEIGDDPGEVQRIPPAMVLKKERERPLSSGRSRSYEKRAVLPPKAAPNL